MSQLRVERLQELIKQETSNMILRELKDPRIGFATVTRVEVTGDLRHAKIYISLMGSDEVKTQTWQGLQSAVGFIRSELGKRIRLKFTPEISLHLDESIEHGARILALLEKVRQGEGNND